MNCNCARALLLLALMALCGCADVDGAAPSWERTGRSLPPVTPETMDVFCQAAAEQQVTGSVFDEPTRDRIKTRSYRQCLDMMMLQAE
jgi:hypothetical protein